MFTFWAHCTVKICTLFPGHSKMLLVSASLPTNVSFCFIDTREPKLLWLAQTAATRTTTMCPWILVPLLLVRPRQTVRRIFTFLWALGPITLISQDSLQHYLPGRVAAPHCVTGLAVLVMSPHLLSTATSNLTENVRVFCYHILKVFLVCFDKRQFPKASMLFLTAKPTPLDLKNNGIIDELPFKSPVTMSWTRPMWV